MAKLFLFGIGGTGSRVIKSLTMLLASGVEMPNTDEVVPIIIDPDATNGDMTRTVEMLEQYRRIRAAGFSGTKGFFKTKISTLKSLSDQEKSATTLGETFQYNINGTKEGRFRDFIDYSLLDATNKAFVDMLYSQENLDLKLDEGFKGNPNIGSVVLNQFKYSNELRQFASLFREGDRIFIVSSIFGGTGAAGFPLLLKNLRNADSEHLANHAFIQNARIGAITVMPYFGVDPKAGGKIDKGTFTSKTKSALSYYHRSIDGPNALNAFYYIGDNLSQDYNYAEGSQAQQNRAHLVELISAMGIIDFMSVSDSEMRTENGKAVNALHREYGIKEDVNPLDFTGLPDDSRARFASCLTQFSYFSLYMRQQFGASLGNQPWSKNGKVKLDSFFTTQPFFAKVRDFTNRYWEWLDEMARNERAFRPFDMATNEGSLYKFVVNIEQKGGFLGLNRSWSYGYFDDRLNAAERAIGDPPAEQKFLNTFYQATADIVKEKFEVL